MEKLFIVEFGLTYEDSTVVRVFTKYETARDWVLSDWANIEAYDFCRIVERELDNGKPFSDSEYEELEETVFEIKG